METLTFQELEIKYFPEIEEFCFNVLKNKSEAVLNAASVFTTFQRMIAKQGVDKWQDENKIMKVLFLIARTKCIDRLQWLRRDKEKRFTRNIFILFFRRILKIFRYV